MVRRASYLFLALVVLSTVRLAQADDEKAKRPDTEVKAIAKIKEAGGQVMELAQNDPRLEVSLHLTGGKVTDETLKPLVDMKDLVHLNLRGTDVTDAGMATVGKLTSLIRLHLERTKITDAGLAQLKGLTNLEYLNVYDTAVTDTGLAQLDGLKKLKKLYVTGTKVSQMGINKIKGSVKGLEVTPDYELEARRAHLEYRRSVDDAKAAVAETQKAAEELTKKIATPRRLRRRPWPPRRPRRRSWTPP